MKEKVEQEEIFSQILRAGRRTYFFDVRSTKADDYYLTRIIHQVYNFYNFYFS